MPDKARPHESRLSQRVPGVAVAGEPRRRFSDRAHAAIRRMIIDGTLQPGARVSEPELSTRISLGRAATRAALVRLSQERLVIPIPRQGYLVAPLTIKDAREILDLRILLEPRAAYLAAGRIDASLLPRIERNFAAGYDHARPGSLDAFLATNREFRTTVARAGGNDRLADSIVELIDGMERYLRLGLLSRDRNEEILDGHRRLARALLSADAAEAERVSRSQMEETMEMVMHALMSREEVLHLSLGAEHGREPPVRAGD